MEVFDEYQLWTRETFVICLKKGEKKERYAYLALGLVGESGEVAEKIKKFLRGDDGDVFSDERKEEIKKEMGDVLWYAARLADELDIKLSDIAKLNRDKLEARIRCNKIKGKGDNR